MNQAEKVYRDTYELFRNKYNDEFMAWTRFIEFLAVDHRPYLIKQMDHKFEDLESNAGFIEKLKSVYKPAVLHPDHSDYLGQMYMERQGSSTIERKGQFLTPESVSDMLAQMTIGEDVTRRINVLDPCVGTGRLLLSAYRVNPNSNLFGVDIDINALHVAYANMAIRGIKDFYLLNADSLRNETDISKKEGCYNWQFANQWNSHMHELKPIGHFEEQNKQLELALA